MPSDAKDFLVLSQMLRAENQFQLEGGNQGEAFAVLAHGAFLGSLSNGVVLLGMILKLWKLPRTWVPDLGTSKARHNQDGQCPE